MSKEGTEKQSAEVIDCFNLYILDRASRKTVVSKQLGHSAINNYFGEIV